MSSLIDIEDVVNTPLDQLIVCPECDLLMAHSALNTSQQIVCPCCDYKLLVLRRAMVKRSLSLVITALILFIPANFFPILIVDLLGQKQQSTVFETVLGLYNSGMQPIAVVVMLCSFVVPLCKLFCQLFVLLMLKFQKGKRLAISFFKGYQQLKEWGMLDIYLLGILVSIVKLHGMAELHIGTGLICFVMLLLVQVWLEVVMSSSQVWELLDQLGGDNASD